MSDTPIYDAVVEWMKKNPVELPASELEKKAQD